MASRPVWGAWIEIHNACGKAQQLWSRPVWGAWIEIPATWRTSATAYVAPRMGRVD